MELCLLCLQTQSEFSSYIPIHSQRWLQLKILGTIETHFWPIENLQNIVGICSLCWSKLNAFHTFYQTIEEAHRRDIHYFKEEEKSGGIFQIAAPQFFKLEQTSNENSTCTINEFDDIKIEDSLDEYEPITSVPKIRIRNKIKSNSTALEKRKRGRPRKNHNVDECSHQSNIKKPKGKRGRPRKNFIDMTDKQTNITTLGNNSNVICPKTVSHQTKERNSSTQTALVTSIRRGRPPKVERRGRPRKIQISNEDSTTKEIVSTLEIHNNKEDLINQSPKAEREELNDNLTSNLSNNECMSHKKIKFFSVMKKRKRVQHHKFLMRNYIATSVRCMNFFKK